MNMLLRSIGKAGHCAVNGVLRRLRPPLDVPDSGAERPAITAASDGGRRLRFALIAGVLLWGASVTAGMLTLVSYSNTPGTSGPVAQELPATEEVAVLAERATLLMFVHPRCACSRSSLEQLARIQARCRGMVAIRIYFYCPSDKSPDWAKTATWEFAQRIPDTSVEIDADGQTAGMIGASTSGHVVLYDTRNQLAFSGGITGGRGHEGDNIGTSAVVACLRGEPMVHVRTPAFGCAIPSQSRSSTAPLELRSLPRLSGD